MLGGNPGIEAVEKMREPGLDPNTNSEAYEARWPEVLKACEDAAAEELRKSPSSVACTCSAPASRVPPYRQPAARSFPAVRVTRRVRFYLSLTDELMRLFTPAWQPASWRQPRGLRTGLKIVSRAIATAQSNVEGRNAEQRKNVLKV